MPCSYCETGDDSHFAGCQYYPTRCSEHPSVPVSEDRDCPVCAARKWWTSDEDGLEEPFLAWLEDECTVDRHLYRNELETPSDFMDAFRTFVLVAGPLDHQRANVGDVCVDHMRVLPCRDCNPSQTSPVATMMRGLFGTRGR